MSKKVNVLEIIMTEESIHDDRLGNEISSLIQRIDEQAYLLQHREGFQSQHPVLVQHHFHYQPPVKRLQM